jgi:hypothetical protein
VKKFAPASDLGTDLITGELILTIVEARNLDVEVSFKLQKTNIIQKEADCNAQIEVSFRTGHNPMPAMDTNVFQEDSIRENEINTQNLRKCFTSSIQAHTRNPIWTTNLSPSGEKADLSENDMEEEEKKASSKEESTNMSRKNTLTLTKEGEAEREEEMKRIEEGVRAGRLKYGDELHIGKLMKGMLGLVYFTCYNVQLLNQPLGSGLGIKHGQEEGKEEGKQHQVQQVSREQIGKAQ